MPSYIRHSKDSGYDVEKRLLIDEFIKLLDPDSHYLRHEVAFRKRKTHETIMVDIDTHMVIALIASREVDDP